MKVPTYEGIVENGRIRLLEDVVLPERAKVYVIVPEVVVELPALPSVVHVRSPRLAHPEQAKDYVKEVRDASDEQDQSERP